MTATAERITSYAHTATSVRARKVHPCDAARDRTCRVRIMPGELYVRSTLFPGHDANTGTRPVQYRLCAECAAAYVDTVGLIV